MLWRGVTQLRAMASKTTHTHTHTHTRTRTRTRTQTGMQVCRSACTCGSATARQQHGAAPCLSLVCLPGGAAPHSLAMVTPFFRRRVAQAPATAPPTATLFFTSAMLARRDSPPVSSLIRFRRKGVTSLPLMPWACASPTAFVVASSTLAASAASSSGTGTAMTTPEAIPMQRWLSSSSAMASGLSTRHVRGRPLCGVKKAGKSLVR
mmetsp:Transcript_106797/g.340109  ORF Transcript_106797/g.340109 Transcript_106797/m.340109 type:complete len:207 (-) Transcript_106797:597-1217(-)